MKNITIKVFVLPQKIARKNRMFFIVAFITLLFSSNKLLSVPASPELVTITQPDNSKIQVYIRGDENINWFESPEQFTLIKNNDGYIVYATKNVNGDLIPSNHIYRNNEQQLNFTKRKTEFINNLNKKLFFSKKQVEQFINTKKPNINTKKHDNFQAYPVDNIEGTRKYLVILMSYQDLPFQKTREEYEKLFNEIGYQDNDYGSVKDYYIHNSYSKFIPEFVVLGPYITNQNVAYYKINSQELASEAIEWAYDDIYKLGLKISDFDNTGDGYIDAVSIIFAGWGEENGFQDGIWSHASRLEYPVSYDGKFFHRYCCSPELRGNGGSNINTIGVHCHEFCHTLGALDFYDVDYVANGQYQGAGNWCLMAGGNWNFGGNCPANINIFQKWMFGWVEPIVLTTQDAEVYNMPNSAYNSVAYRIDTDTEDEFYIMENRQQTGFDRFVPGHGLLIWHIHQATPFFIDAWYNALNYSHPQLVYPVCASATVSQPNASPSSYGSVNSSGTPFPGTSNNTEFTDKSTPSANSWNGKPTNRPITNITEVDSFISFNYKGRPNYVHYIPYWYDIKSVNHYNDFYSAVSSENVGIDWRRIQENNGNCSIELRSYNFIETHPEHYLFLPVFYLEKNYVYSFRVNYKVYHQNQPGNMKLYLLNSKNINDNKILLNDFGNELNKTTYTEISADFKVPADGVYYLAICSYSVGSMNIFINEINIDGAVGIESTNDNSISIFPNPTKDNLYIINSSDEEIESIDFFDIDAKNVLTTKNTNIDISKLVAGTYLIKIATNKKTYIEKIVKE